ncbi:MAG: surface lipoprotein assembly modifier [Woeseiaceae bacterium]|nr:surface lipoprotein assembly modifier [Woeseiaceae bacterium]
MTQSVTTIFQRGCLVAASFLVLTAARADDPEFGLEARIGYLSDSNVNVAELNENTGASDTAVDLDFGIDGKLPLGERVSANFGYDYSGTQYSEFTEFNLALHQLRGGLNLKAAGFDAGLLAERYVAKLDGDDFLEISQVTPSLGRLFGDRLYLRGAWTAAEKTYAENELRDASNRSLRADAYVLLDGMNRFISLGYVSSSENALDETLDYDGDRLLLGFGQRFGEGERSLMLRLRAQFEIRDYAGFDESIEDTRSDERFRAEATATWGLTEHLSIEGKAAYADNQSNLETATYSETVLGLSIGVSF